MHRRSGNQRIAGVKGFRLWIGRKDSISTECIALRMSPTKFVPLSENIPLQNIPLQNIPLNLKSQPINKKVLVERHVATVKQIFKVYSTILRCCLLLTLHLKQATHHSTKKVLTTTENYSLEIWNSSRPIQDWPDCRPNLLHAMPEDRIYFVSSYLRKHIGVIRPIIAIARLHICLNFAS